MNSPPLNITEAELAGLRANFQQDGFLLDLIRLADRGAGVPIGLLTNGMVVIGTLTASETFAEQLDEYRQRLLQGVEKPEETSDDDWAKAVESFATSSVRAVERFREQDKKLTADIETHEAKEELPPGDLQLAVIDRNTRPQLTLKDAKVFASGTSETMQIPVLRVAVSNVSSWWTPNVDSSGDAEFSLFAPEDSAA